MEIRDGWNTTLGRRKFDVTLDDSDFQGLLTDVGLHPETHVPAGIKFRILRQQAAILALGELHAYLSRSGDDEEADKDAVREAEEAVTERNSLLRQLMEQARQ